MNPFIFSRSTNIKMDCDCEPMQNAAAILRRDISQHLTGSGPKCTIRLTKDAALSEETYRVRITERLIDVDYADELGAVYALLSISERMLGVLPLDYWNDRHIMPRETAEIPCGEYASPTYAVRFRGWTINDEVLLDGWKDSAEDERAMWGRVFETILRCGGNMVIPGTDRRSDELCEMALASGLWLTQSHTELLGARMFGRVYPDLQPSYIQHQDLFEQLWQEPINKFGGRKVIWTLGFRGQGDCAFWEADAAFDTQEKRGALISRVMRRQMEIVREKDPNARFCTNLYGEMMDLYRQGALDVPDGVVKIWGDNGYGKMVSRRQNNDNPRVASMPAQGESGQNGLYYHASFYDLQAANHITMSPNSPDLIATELGDAIDLGASEYWLINAGSIKPHTYILDLIRATWTKGRVDVNTHARDYARGYYGDERVAQLLLDYAECTLPYGPNQDDRAGDQYYHFPLRYLARRWMRGEFEPAKELIWAADGNSLVAQAADIGARCAGGIAGWRDYLGRCESVATSLENAAAQILRDTLVLQATLHLTGCEALRDMSRAMSCHSTEPVRAYLYVDRALNAHRRGLGALRAAEHGEFTNYYRNECFTNVALTVQVLEAVRGWLRVCGDGRELYDWEKRYLVPKEDTLVMCLTHRTNQLDDDALCSALHAYVELED